MKASSKDAHCSLSRAVSIHLGPAAMSSIHLVIGFPLYRFPIGPFHHVTRLVHRSSFNLATWPPHFHFTFEQDLKRRR